MRLPRGALALLFGALALGAGARRAEAQSDVRVDLPRDDPFPAAPEITVHAVGLPASTAPRRIRLRLALESGFALIVYDSSAVGDDVTFRTQRLLPENRDIFLEATVFDAAGRSIRTLVTRAGRTGPRLQLIAPNGRTSISLLTRQPRFSWRAATVTSPPGPWIYELFITNVATQETRSRLGIRDTVYTYPDTLQANTSYRWKVVARLQNGFASDSGVAASQSSFVIAPSDAPVSTLLYQNFPNPFPAPSSPSTCFWFDLQTAASVQLTVHDLRGNRVRTMIPSAQFPSMLPSGRYGRLREIDASGCDPRLAWDGTADDGHVVPAGIYLVRMKTDRTETFKKILFLGR